MLGGGLIVREFLKAYLIFWSIFMAVVLAVSLFVNNSFGELVARNWLLAVVMACSPIPITMLGLLRGAAVLLPFQAATVALQMYVAYGIKGYSGKFILFGPNMWEALCLIIFYFGLAQAAMLLSKLVTNIDISGYKMGSSKKESQGDNIPSREVVRKE